MQGYLGTSHRPISKLTGKKKKQEKKKVVEVSNFSPFLFFVAALIYPRELEMPRLSNPRPPNFFFFFHINGQIHHPCAAVSQAFSQLHYPPFRCISLSTFFFSHFFSSVASARYLKRKNHAASSVLPKSFSCRKRQLKLNTVNRQVCTEARARRTHIRGQCRITN